MSASARVEDQVQEDLMRLEAYRGQLSAVYQQYQMLTASRADHQRARDALDGLDVATPPSDVLIPIGGEAFIRGNPDRTGKVFLAVGSGLVAEIDRGQARETLQQRLKQIDEAGRDLEGQIRQLEVRIRGISQRIESLSARSGPSAGGRDDVGLD
ncbi:MAG: prefoldin subunit alpha [Thermoplasmata archaeon]|nr:prefoldin subunit alpha [Thermoplasmata archaeon]